MAGTRRKDPSQYDFLKQLFDEVLLPTSGPKRRSSVRTRKIRHIDIHHMTVQDSDDGAANFKCLDIWDAREASAHYCIDNLYVLQAVYDNRMAWGNGNGTANQEGIIVEHANSTIGDKAGWKISETTLETSAKVVAGLHITHKLGRPTSTGFGTGGTIRTHQSFYATACPGPYFKKVWDRYVKMVQAAYDVMVKGDVPEAPKPTEPSTEQPITGDTYAVVKGDTLAAIARRATRTVTIADLAAWNGLDDPAKINVGRELRLTPPEQKTATVTLLYGNLAGYNADTAPGVTRWKANADGFAALVNKRKPGIVATVEESNRAQNKMRPRIDAALGKDYTRMAGGSDGRYNRRRAGSVKAIKSWVYETPHKFRGDDKQMACFAFEVDGIRGLIGTFHAENESGIDKATGKSGDQFRVDQVGGFCDHLLEKARDLDVAEENVFAVGDGNSESWVADDLIKRGFKILGRANFVGWDGKSKRPFNLLVGKGEASDFESLTTKFSDHQFIAATLHLSA